MIVIDIEAKPVVVLEFIARNDVHRIYININDVTIYILLMILISPCGSIVETISCIVCHTNSRRYI